MIFKKQAEEVGAKMVDCDGNGNGNAGLLLYRDGENCGTGFSRGRGRGRWPRQETLTLLEIRTRLHPKFKQAAAHRAPLWDEVSRIMAEEHGYQRSARKCKEKLDNLYKYYKKTKVAKGGCQDGKHYRFFKQLEALYGGNNQMPNCLQVITSTSTPIHQPQESLESKEEEEFDDTISSEEEEEEEEGFEIYDGWNVKLRGLIETQMRRLMEVQESWLGKTLHAVERMEQERVYREEAWRRKELARSEQEERLWACEKAWIEARGAALVNALQRIGRKCRYVKKVHTLLMTQDEEESTSMYGYDGDNNRKKEIKESEAVLTLDSDEIAEMIRLQGWVQPELDEDQYHGSGLAQLR